MIWRAIMRILRLDRREPSLEARRARAQAAESMRLAQRARATAEQLRDESDVVVRELRAHNAANRYDEWLAQFGVRR